MGTQATELTKSEKAELERRKEWLDLARSTLIPAKPEKNLKSRLSLFLKWADEDWLIPQLGDYVFYLQSKDGGELKAATIRARLSTIRERYKVLVSNRDFLYKLVPGDVKSKTERYVHVEEMIARINNAIAPHNSRIKVIKKQDVADSEHRRLTKKQAIALMKSPRMDTLKGLRDTAILVTFLCTGIREMELKGLIVSDIQEKLDSDLSLRVREGKGCTQRLVPYGDLRWAVPVIEEWLSAAGIADGPVFRAFTSKKCEKVRITAISERSIQNILKDYPIVIDGKLVRVKPHDLRRTYARSLYDSGMELKSIQENLGHKDLATTLRYIGVSNAKARRPTAIYTMEIY